MLKTALQHPARGLANARLIAVIAVVAVIALGGYFFWRSQPEPEPLPELAPATPLEMVEPAKTSEERGDSAREVIAQLRADPENVDYAKAHQRAVEFLREGRFADAQLLYFFAARGGHGGAALDLATLYDPNHFSADNGLMEEPDPFQSYKWYQSARAAGEETASARLEALRAWAENAANAGDSDAERLLLQWE